MDRAQLRAFPLLVKSLDNAAGTFSGLAAAYSNVDKTNDVIAFGAFAKTLEAARERKNVTKSGVLWPLCMMHDEKRPVGGIVAATERPDGLWIEAFCDMATIAGREAFSGLRSGYAADLSIGYRTVRSAKDTRTGARRLTEIQLFEVSLVTTGFAANDHAGVDMASVKMRLTRAVNSAASAAADADTSWKATRPRREAPQYSKPIPDAPDRSQFASRRDYETAAARWIAECYGLPVESTRPVIDKDGATHDAAFMQHNSSRIERHLALIAQMEQRVLMGLGTPAEIRDYYAHHGVTPDGRTLPDDTEGFQRAVAEMQARLAGILPLEED